jgi:acyl dehydratase
LSEVDVLRQLVGTEVGVGQWLAIEQERIDQFADATGDHQWIHVDPDRAANGPFGSTVAHGYLTLGLLPYLTQGIEIPVGQPRLAINYGLDRLRFPAPVKVGQRVRARVTLTGVEEVDGGLQIARRIVVEVEGGEKPALVADTLSRLIY